MQKSPKKVTSYEMLEKLGRVRLSEHFFMREMLYSSIGDYHGLPNYPENPELAIKAGSELCRNLLDPLQDTFGRISIRSAYRSPTVNDYGNKNGLNCASNEKNYAKHIWDYRDKDGCLGATATIIVNSYIPHYEETRNWQALAWYIHDHLPYSSLYFYPKLCALNISWHENSKKRIDSYVTPKGCLTKPGMDNHNGDHSSEYSWIL